MGYSVEVSGPERPALISVRTEGEGLPAVEQALGVRVPRAAVEPVSANDSLSVFRVGPDEWLVRTGLDEEGDRFATLDAALTRSAGAAILVSDAYRVFTIAGSETLDVLAQATGVDIHPSVFPAGRAVRAAFARTDALLHRVDDRPAFDIYVDATLARYAAQWIEAAIGGRPAGRPG